MVLALAVHTIQDRPTARVPLSMIALLDLVKTKGTSTELKCRQVFPTSGQRSTSLWDVPDVEALQSWLDEYLDVGCTNEVFEVQEEFAYGISAELTRVRTTERVTTAARGLGAAVGERTKPATDAATAEMRDIDSKYHVSAQTSAALKAAQDTGSAAAKNTAAAFNKLSIAARAQYSKAMQNDKEPAQVSTAASSAGQMGTQVTNNLKALGQSWWGPSKPPTMPEGTSTPPTESQAPPVRMGGFGTAPGSQPASKAAPAAAAQPARAKAQAPKDADQTFTLDDLDEGDQHTATEAKPTSGQ